MLVRILWSVLIKQILDTKLVLQVSLHPFDIRNQLIIFGRTGDNIAMNKLVSSIAKTVICFTEIYRKKVLPFYQLQDFGAIDIFITLLSKSFLYFIFKYIPLTQEFAELSLRNGLSIQFVYISNSTRNHVLNHCSIIISREYVQKLVCQRLVCTFSQALQLIQLII